MGKVTIAEAKHIRMVNWFRGKGYNASYNAYPDSLEEVPEKEHIHLEMILQRSTSFCFVPYKKRMRVLFGELWMKHPVAGATPKNFVLHVRGREFFEQLTNLAREFAEEFNVDVHVRLERENPIEYDLRPL